MITSLLTRLVGAAGVDYVQWRALIRAKVMIDYSALLGAYGPVAARRAAWHLLLQWLFFGMLGAMPAFVIVFARDSFFAATVMVTVTSTVVAMFVLMLAGTLISPDDYAVIGYRPVSSTTYFAARVTGLLTHTAEIAALAGYPSVVAFVIRSGGSARIAGAAVMAIGASAVATTLFVAAFYGWLLGRVNPKRLQKIVVLTGAFGMVLVAGGGVFLAAMTFVDIGGTGAGPSVSLKVDQTLVKSLWTLLYPGTWFAAWLEVARGVAGTFEWTGCALSVTVLAVLAATLGGRMSTGYTDRVADMTTAPASVVRADPAWRLLVNERRALAVLVRHMLRTDMTLQIGMAMQVAMSIGLAFFLAMDRPSDPFLGLRSSTSSTGMFMLFLLPRGLRQDMVMSPSSRASWLFFSTPADRARLVTGMRDLIAIGVLPLLFVGVAGFFIYAYGHVGHALIDSALLCSCSYVTLQMDALFDPRLPFSVPVVDRRGGFMPRGNWRVFVGCMLVYEAFALSRHLLYRNGWTLALGLVVIAVVIATLNRLTRRRVVTKIQSAEYFE
jgi:hypothetical protein